MDKLAQVIATSYASKIMSILIFILSATYYHIIIIIKLEVSLVLKLVFHVSHGNLLGLMVDIGLVYSSIVNKPISNYFILFLNTTFYVYCL